jgi:hypothetical protein
MKKFLAGGAVILAGVSAAVVGSFSPGEATGKYNLCYVVDPGGGGLSAGLALEARQDLTQDFSPIETGEESGGLRYRLTVRTVAITEAEANSVNAFCRCLKVNDLENPTGLEPVQ